MKILMIAHTINEEGCHYPGEILEMRDELAMQWVKDGWAIAQIDPIIETAHHGGAHETTEGLGMRGRGRPRKIVDDQSSDD